MKQVAYYKNFRFSTGTTTGKDFLEFAKIFRKELKKEIQKKNLKLLNYSSGHYILSGFVKNTLTGKFAYFSIPDVRHWRNWAEDILVRTAKNEEDYTGGSNNFVKVEDLPKMLEKLTS